jgi:hypothetical protein
LPEKLREVDVGKKKWIMGEVKSLLSLREAGEEIINNVDNAFVRVHSYCSMWAAHCV